LTAVPQIRICCCNDAPVNPGGDFVLYWMIAFRRASWNFSLDRAIEWAQELRKPLLVLEALRCDYQWASVRLHQFVLEGMAANAARCRHAGVCYYPYVEPELGADKGLLAALSERACVVVTDEFPCFFLPRMVRSVARSITVRMEQIDSNGLLPLRAIQTVFPSAFGFRRFLQKSLPEYLLAAPRPNPLEHPGLPATANVPPAIARRWPPASDELLAAKFAALAALPINQGVGPGAVRGGPAAARLALKAFLDTKLGLYGAAHSHPDADAASGLSPYLHFGHISAHEVFHELARREKWTGAKLALKPSGSRTGWWGMSGNAEAFLDELITWREVGFNFAAHRHDYDQYESLPDWAVATLAKHASDPRPHRYGLKQLEAAETHDALWNAAQTQIVTEGRMQNYLRMLWGKKILEWSKTPRAALAVMIELNNKYGLDGRDPNSYSGIFWTLGRYDRPWFERPIFGVVRYMSSENTARKLRLKKYLRKFGRP
jgi:deoxyribodipyrimidine photo-lyase